jgi:hypothetical protein
MAQSDTAVWAALVERVEKLEQQVKELMEARSGKDMQSELYGDPADHTEERAERAALTPRRPGRPPGS